jgi:hypothetical protein
MDGPVGRRYVCRFILVAEVKVSSHPGSGFGLAEIGSVAMHIEDHIAFMESDFCVWVGCCVVEELD